MNFAHQATEQKFPHPFSVVFDALIKVVPESGMRLKRSDKAVGVITASAGMSAYSCGENLSLVVEELEGVSCLVKIQSDLKIGINLGGADRHQINFDRIT